MNNIGFLRVFVMTSVLLIANGAQTACRRVKKDAIPSVEKSAASARAGLFEADRNDDAARRSSLQRRINLNTASREELMRLPGIGAGLAARIVEHRARYGKFRRPEHILMVDGIGAHRFARIRELIEVR
jgi:competence ComEA-like helix-hairpin-helix protein